MRLTPVTINAIALSITSKIRATIYGFHFDKNVSPVFEAHFESIDVGDFVLCTKTPTFAFSSRDTAPAIIDLTSSFDTESG